MPRRVPEEGGSASPNSSGGLAVPGTQCQVAGDRCWVSWEDGEGVQKGMFALGFAWPELEKET